MVDQAIVEKPVENLPATTGGFRSIIEKAAALDNVDVDKLERMMAMQLQWEERQARKLFDEAKARASQKLKNIKIEKTRSVSYDIDKNDKSKGQKEAFKFAALEDIDKLIAPVLAEEKIDVSYKIEPCALAGWHTIVCWLEHGGHREPYPMPMPLDTSGGKGNAQAMGSTQTYGQRRALCGAFNIITIGMDDDGMGGNIDDAQAKNIKDMMQGLELDAGKVLRFLKYMKAESVEKILFKDYRKATSFLEEKLAKKKAGDKNANPA